MTPVFPDLYEASIRELQEGLQNRHFTSIDLVKAYFSRIDEVNLKGPELRAIIELNPSALVQAEELDKERVQKGKRSDMHGIPVLLKDNIATVTSEGMNTTSGSYSLLGSIVSADAHVVKRLRAAGAIMLGKTNMSEFAFFRSSQGELPSGWSGRGGQATSAYYPNGDPRGSSSGSAIAVSIGLATVTLGTETDGSIISPSSINNIVGLKPTVGLTSRSGVIPVSLNFDSVGPMCRSVEDTAIVLSLIAGKDDSDTATSSQPSPVPSYTEALTSNAFQGKRIGVPRHVFFDVKVDRLDPSISVAFQAALDIIRSLGADVVDPADLPSADAVKTSPHCELHVLETDFKIDLNEYLKNLEGNVAVRSLADVIQFNNDHPELEKPTGYEGQGRLIRSNDTPGRDEAYIKAAELNMGYGRTNGIDAAARKHNLDAFVIPSTGPPFTPVALAGYPIITGFLPDNAEIKLRNGSRTYPVEQAPGMPFGLSFFGMAYSEYQLLGFAYAFEQATRARLARRAYPAAIPKTQLRDLVHI